MISLPRDPKERIEVMLALMRGETVTFELDGERHTLTPMDCREDERRVVPVALTPRRAQATAGDPQRPNTPLDCRDLDAMRAKDAERVIPDTV
jgi:hypothetical protein